MQRIHSSLASSFTSLLVYSPGLKIPVGFSGVFFASDQNRGWSNIFSIFFNIIGSKNIEIKA